MKTFKVFARFPSIMLVLSMVLLSFISYAQTMMPLPPHSTVYSGIYARGYNFTAPMNFTITGLKVAPEAGSGLQYIHVMKCNTPFPISSGSASTNFTTLAYISGATNNTIQNVNISVSQGDIIAILGTVTGISNSYSASGVHTSTIGSNTVYLNRTGYQGSIENGPALSYWGVANNTSGQIGRIFMYYTIATPTDAGITRFIDPIDTVCSSAQPVQVELKNFGPATLDSVYINWSVNNISQPAFYWTGTLNSDDSTNVVIGNYNFLVGTTYDLQASTNLPNGAMDSTNTNDSAFVGNIFVKQGPTALPSSTSLSICEGDSVLIGGSLTGIPPWNITVSDGINTYSVNNITLPLFGMYVKPTTTTTYTVTSLSDATGCVTISTPPIVVDVLTQPPAFISTLSTTTFCEGDSVILQANIGPGLYYHWQKDGQVVSGTDSAYVAYQSGSYAVIVSNIAGCDSISAAITVTVYPLPVVDLGNDTVIGANQSVILDAGSGYMTYLWSTGSNSQTIYIDSNGFGIGSHTYFVTVSDNHGCKGTDDIQVTFVNNPGIDEDLINKTYSIFPNPADDKINVILSAPCLPADIEIYSPVGMKVYQTRSSDNVEINVTDWPKGVYFLTLRSQWFTSNTKVLIE